MDRQLLVLLMVMGSAGCASPPMRVQLRAPNPNGCYVIVYERPDFQGAGAVLNGPVRLSSLERLAGTDEASWRNRIRSLSVGNAAAVTAYVNAAFTGDSRKFAPGTQQPQLGDAFSARIGSLEITCIKQIAMLRHWNRTIARLGIHGNSALNRGEEKARRAL